MSFTVDEILEWTQGRLVNATDLDTSANLIRVDRPSRLRTAQTSHLAFFFSKAFQEELGHANPGVLITAEPYVKALEQAKLPFWKRCAVIACKDPYLAMALLSEKFAHHSSVSHVPQDLKGTGASPTVHPTAVLHPSVILGPQVKIGAHCVIEENVTIGAGTTLYPGCYIGPDVSIGDGCVLFPKVTVYEWTQIGNRVRLHAGAVIGSDGFGYAPRIHDSIPTGHQKIYHLGSVLIEDDVEIGANSTVDRGTFGETRIRSQAKIDNLVHLGHNAEVGQGAILCGGVCLAGHANIGKFVYVGGLTGVSNHVQIGDGAKLGACSLISKDVPAGEIALGNPQRDHREHFRAQAMLSKLLKERRKK